jgi:P4 family phage/plasmid primase-like protien
VATNAPPVAAAEASPPVPDRALIERWWARFCGPDDTHEIRIPKVRKGPKRWYKPQVGYFRNRSADDLAAVGRTLATITGQDTEAVYVTLNPVPDELRARSDHHLRNAESTARDQDIPRRRKLLVDIDPNRASGIAATDAEMQAALAMRDTVLAFLAALGWPAPLYHGMSGSGAMIVYALDEPNDATTETLITDALAALAHEFDGAVVKIDTSVHNASRLTKVPGTVGARGDHCPDLGRVWRLATAEFCDEAQPVPRARLEALAALAPATTARGTGSTFTGTGWSADAITAALDRRGVGYKTTQESYATVYLLDQCLTSDAHTDGARIGQGTRGGWWYTCHHETCQTKQWADAKTALGLVWEPWAAPTDGTAARNGYAHATGHDSGGDGDEPADDREPTAAAPPEARPCTDLGNSERLLDRYGRDLLYCDALPAGWLTWTDGCWRSDGTREVYERAKATVRSIYTEADAAPRASERKELAQWAVRSEAAGKIEALVSLARSAIAVEASTFDADSWLLNVQNGVIDLRTGLLLPHRRDLRLTKQALVAYDAHATCPRFEQFLREVFAGDAALASFLQRAIGYSLTGDTRERVLFVLHGRGRNGKDTLLEIITALLGDYALRTPADTLLTHDKDRARVPDDVAALRGARFVPASETDEGRALSEARVKELTGNQTLSARHLYGRYFQFQPEFKLWLATNHKPTIRGTDDGIWDRLRLLPFDVRFYLPWEERPPDGLAADMDLKATLRAELPGILAWAVRGCLAWQREGLGMPEAIQKANTAYRADMDVLAPFLTECCVLSPFAYVSVSALYRAYATWAEASGERPLGKRTFGNRLIEHGCGQCRGTGGEHRWLGIGLLERERAQ